MADPSLITALVRCEGPLTIDFKVERKAKDLGFCVPIMIKHDTPKLPLDISLVKVA